MGGVNDHMEAFKHLLEEIGGLLIGTSLGAAIGGIIGFFSPVPGGMAIGAGIGARIGAGVGLLGGAGLAASSPPDPNLAAAPKGGSNAVAPAGGTAPAPGAGGTGLTTLQADRARFAEELRLNPGLKDELFKHATGENNDPLANKIIMETAMNRASQRHTSLAAQLGYFQGYRGYDSKHAAMMEQNLKSVLSGSNEGLGATDNSSGGLAEREKASGKFIHRRTVNGESFFIPGSAEKGLQRSYGPWAAQRGLDPTTGLALPSAAAPVPAQAAPASGSNAVVPAVPAEEGWGHWLGRHMPSFLSPSSSSTTNNKQSSLSIGNMNFHGVRDMKDVADNIQPFIANRFSAVAADTGYG
jgi:hypothetical protein